MWVYLNDRIVQAERARISVFDHGFLYGDGVFETIRVHDGRPVWLDRHLARLTRSCRQIRLPVPDKPWTAIVRKVIDRNRLDHALIRLTLSRGTMFPSPLSAFSEKEGEGHPGEGGETTTVVLFPRPLPHLTPSQRRKGVKVIIATVRRPSPRSGPVQAKTLNYLNNLLAKREAEERGAFDGLLLTTGRIRGRMFDEQRVFSQGQDAVHAVIGLWRPARHHPGSCAGYGPVARPANPGGALPSGIPVRSG